MPSRRAARCLQREGRTYGRIDISPIPSSDADGASA
jgi:hypothetical protein